MQRKTEEADRFGKSAQVGWQAAYFLKVASLCAALLILTVALFHNLPRFSPSFYIPVHTILEFSSIVVSFAVFAVGWYGYNQTGNRRDLFIAVGFLMVGSLDFVHTLSYVGMEPAFLVPENTVGGAAAYWMAARTFDAFALLGAAFILPSNRSRLLSRSVLLPVAAVLIAGITALFTIYHEAVSLAMFDTRLSPPQLTPLKIGLEYFVIALYIVAFFAYGRSRGWTFRSVMALQTALVVGVFSELCFTLYASPYDSLNLLGHVLKVVAYYFVLKALFVSSLQRPYEELLVAQKEGARHLENLEKSFTLIGDALGASLDRQETLELIASLAGDITNAPVTMVAEVGQKCLQPLASRGLPVVSQESICFEQCTAHSVIAEKRSARIDDLDEHSGFCRPELKAAGMRSMLSVPIMHGRQVKGVICVFSPNKAAFGEREERLLEAFSQHAAVAIHNAEIYQQQSYIADTLQRNLLPDVPRRAGIIEFAAKYSPAFVEALVGGDFYDVFELSDGRIGLLIGDVSGKGLAAAVHTAMIKYVVRAYAMEHSNPSSVLGHLNRLATFQLAGDMFVTLIYAVIDTSLGEVVYACAGHENPVLLRRTERELKILDSNGPLIGMNMPGPFVEYSIELDEGDLLLFFTDGLTEARQETRFFGQDGIVAELMEHSNSRPAEIVEALFERAREFSGGRLADDVAIIAVGRNG